LIPLYRDRSALTVPLCLKENCFGVLSVSIPVRFFQDKEEAQLLSEIGADIAYALHDHQIRRSLVAAVEEKNVLIRELYHRTKNNMQVIASMVALRRFAMEDDSQSGVLQEIEGKIHSMALVHQRLYLAKDLSRFDLKSYIEELAELIHATFEDQSKHIEFDFDLEPADGLIDTAVPLGLVINELLINAIKHAFPERDTGRVLIRLTKIGEGALHLSLEDNGIGLPQGFKPERAESLGLQTVYNIVTNQLNGSLKVRSNGGTHWDLTVGDVGYKERV
jgi:two-component sensor histidine kinase